MFSVALGLSLSLLPLYAAGQEVVTECNVHEDCPSGQYCAARHGRRCVDASERCAVHQREGITAADITDNTPAALVITSRYSYCDAIAADGLDCCHVDFRKRCSWYTDGAAADSGSNNPAGCGVIQSGCDGELTWGYYGYMCEEDMYSTSAGSGGVGAFYWMVVFGIVVLTCLYCGYLINNGCLVAADVALEAKRERAAKKPSTSDGTAVKQVPPGSGEMQALVPPAGSPANTQAHLQPQQLQPQPVATVDGCDKTCAAWGGGAAAAVISSLVAMVMGVSVSLVFVMFCGIGVLVLLTREQLSALCGDEQRSAAQVQVQVPLQVQTPAGGSAGQSIRMQTTQDRALPLPAEETASPTGNERATLTCEAGNFLDFPHGRRMRRAYWGDMATPWDTQRGRDVSKICKAVLVQQHTARKRLHATAEQFGRPVTVPGDVVKTGLVLELAPFEKVPRQLDLLFPALRYKMRRLVDNPKAAAAVTGAALIQAFGSIAIVKLLALMPGSSIILIMAPCCGCCFCCGMCAGITRKLNKVYPDEENNSTTYSPRKFAFSVWMLTAFLTLIPVQLLNIGDILMAGKDDPTSANEIHTDEGTGVTTYGYTSANEVDSGKGMRVTMYGYIPGLIFGETNGVGPEDWGTASVTLFVCATWSIGWMVAWYRATKIRPVLDVQHQLGMPTAGLNVQERALFKLRLVSVIVECYGYCGFSFFPAVPWAAVEVPPGVPQPSVFFMAGFMEFGTDATVQFFGAVCVVLLGFGLLRLGQEDPIVVQVFFEILSFPLLKKLASVFSCTSGARWMKEEDEQGRIAAYRFCDDAGVKFPPGKLTSGTYITSPQCMTNDPTISCWHSEHAMYVTIAMVLLPLYYIAILTYQGRSQARQSVLIIDGMWAVAANQSKFLLALLSSMIGTCYPHVLLLCVEVVVLCQLAVMLSGRAYSNVHSMNSIRRAGLLCAAFNCMYAALIVWVYRDDIRGGDTCFTMQQAIEVNSGDKNLNTLVQGYGAFVGLLLGNAIAVGMGIRMYKREKDAWMESATYTFETTYSSLADINSTADAKETDYPIVKGRLEMLTKLVAQWIADKSSDQGCETHTTESCLALQPQELKDLAVKFALHEQEAWKVFNLHMREGDAESLNDSQQVESATLKMVMQHPLLSDPFGVNIMNVHLGTTSGALLIDYLASSAKEEKKGKAPGFAAKIHKIQITNLGVSRKEIKQREKILSSWKALDNNSTGYLPEDDVRRVLRDLDRKLKEERLDVAMVKLMRLEATRAVSQLTAKQSESDVSPGEASEWLATVNEVVHNLEPPDSFLVWWAEQTTAFNEQKSALPEGKSLRDALQTLGTTLRHTEELQRTLAAYNWVESEFRAEVSLGTVLAWWLEQQHDKQEREEQEQADKKELQSKLLRYYDLIEFDLVVNNEDDENPADKLLDAEHSLYVHELDDLEPEPEADLVHTAEQADALKADLGTASATTSNRGTVPHPQAATAAEQAAIDLSNSLSKALGSLGFTTHEVGAPAPAPAPAQQTVTKEMQIQCPEGAAAGSLLQVQIPSGATLQVQVPVGISTGQSFPVRWTEVPP